VIAIAGVVLAIAGWLTLGTHKVDTRRVFRIGYASDAPFHFRSKDGAPTGLAVELVQTAARRRGIRLEWKQVAGSATDPIGNGDLDFWVLLTIRPERRRLVHLTDPYLVTETCFLVRADGPFQNVEQLQRARISFLDFGIHRTVLKSLMPEMQPVVADSSREAVAAVSEGRADAAYVDQFAAISALLTDDARKALKVVPSHAPRGLMALASSFSTADVADQLRDEMTAMANDGTMALIVERWGFFPSLTIEAVEELTTARKRVRWLAMGATGLLALLLFTTWLWLTLHRQTEERSKLEQQLQQAQKLESIGRLAGGVAHDFNNLLTIINGYADLLLGELKQGDAPRNHASEIRKAGERGAGLTQQLLAFSRKQIIEPKPVNLNILVADSENMLRRVMGEDIEILTLCDDSLRQVVADAGQINQVLLNLAVNARDAMPAGGKLIIETTNTELDTNYVERHHSVAPGRYVLLTVTDNGVGMDQQTLQRIFDPFFTTKEQGRGTGLGLSTAYGIVKQNGGFISVYSEPGKGTAFRIYLPAIAGVLAAGKEAEPVVAVAGGSETILLVEDQPEVRTLAAKVLQTYGYRVLEGSHGDDALLLAKLHPEPIHLLLTDVIMPGMTGRELAERLKQIDPTIKVLYMSGYSGNAITHQGLLDPGADYISKPFTALSLAGKVRDVLTRAGTRGSILVVDDETGIRQLFEQLLAGEGYEVLCATNGAEALEIVRGRHLDLVITDLVMPESEGIETIRAIRIEQPNLKIIAASGVFEGQFLQAAALLGACATLLKPIGRDQLLSTVRRVLAMTPLPTA
jgi:signal transduction histidine kinase/CheY-like chemotaxis protein